jgi:Uma2 family endonuclease
MADPAIKPMNLDEFLRWDDGTDARYELIGGFPMAMAPPAEGHRILAMRLATRIDAALSGRRPCNAQTETGVLRPDRADMFFIADIGVTCAPYDPRRQHMQDPILLIEILSPSTERHDRRVKLPAYQGIGSVQEILLLAADEAYAELHRRHGDLWVIQIIPAGGSLRLDSVGIEVSLAELYEGLALPAEGAG